MEEKGDSDDIQISCEEEENVEEELAFTKVPSPSVPATVLCMVGHESSKFVGDLVL